MSKPEAHWNYRIVEVSKGVFELRTVHYNRGREIGMSATPPVFGTTAEDDETEDACRAAIVEDMERALKDARTRPILVPPQHWA